MPQLAQLFGGHTALVRFGGLNNTERADFRIRTSNRAFRIDEQLAAALAMLAVREERIQQTLSRIVQLVERLRFAIHGLF